MATRWKGKFLRPTFFNMWMWYFLQEHQWCFWFLKQPVYLCQSVLGCQVKACEWVENCIWWIKWVGCTSGKMEAVIKHITWGEGLCNAYFMIFNQLDKYNIYIFDDMHVSHEWRSRWRKEMGWVTALIYWNTDGEIHCNSETFLILSAFEFAYHS